MNFRDLKYLITLEKLRHFRKAAEQCFVSQPTLSGQIKKLEDELGIQLVERSSRKVIFTNAGLDIVAKAKTILLEKNALEDIASSHMSPMKGTLHIGLIPTVAPYLLPIIISTVKEAFPDLVLYLYENKTSTLLKELDEGQLDCIILPILPEMQTQKKYSLYIEPLELAIPDSHQWSKKKTIPISKLQGENLLMLEDGHCLRDQAMGFCFVAGAVEDNSFKATSLETLRHMVSAKSGLTVFPKLAVPNSRNQNGVIYLPFKAPEPTREIVLLCRQNNARDECFTQLSVLISKTVMKILNEY